MTTFTRECKQVLVAAIPAPDTGKATVQDAGVKIPVKHFLHIRPEKPVLFRKALIIDLLKRLKMVFYALVILRSLRTARAINGRNIGHWLFSLIRGCSNTYQ